MLRTNWRRSFRPSQRGPEEFYPELNIQYYILGGAVPRKPLRRHLVTSCDSFQLMLRISGGRGGVTTYASFLSCGFRATTKWSKLL